jgi:exonuclease VII large subunit
MRNMLTRAAEIRESEQQQIFDALDEIHARMSPLDSIGSVRKRLTELPDRHEFTALAERVAEALSQLEAQGLAVQQLERSVEGLVDKLAKPFAQLDGRLDGVAGRFEGVAGRMDGLDDKLAHIHKRLDEVDLHLDKQDGKVEQVPGAVTGPLRERIEMLEAALRGKVEDLHDGFHQHLDSTQESLQRAVGDSASNMRAQLDETRSALRDAMADTYTTMDRKLDEAREVLHSAINDSRSHLDSSDRLEVLAQRLEQVTSQLGTMSGRIDVVENGFDARIDKLTAVLERGLTKVDEDLSARPDSEMLTSMVRESNLESEQRIGGQLDEAMATFAELILGGSQSASHSPVAALPRAQRRVRKSGPKAVESSLHENEEELAAGA